MNSAFGMDAQRCVHGLTAASVDSCRAGPQTGAPDDVVSADRTRLHGAENPLQCQRSRFDIPDQITWLDAAYMSPLSQATVAAGFRGVERRAKPWGLPSSEFFREVEAARMEFAKLINATSDDVAIVPAVSYGIEVAARNLPVRKGDRIVVLAACRTWLKTSKT